MTNKELKAAREKSLNIYKADVEPLVFQLKEKCRKLGMPVFISVCVCTGEVPEKDAQKPEYRTEYINDLISPYACGRVKLEPDYIAEFIKVVNGFESKTEEDDFEAEIFGTV